jgi:serine/threonine protein kinase
MAPEIYQKLGHTISVDGSSLDFIFISFHLLNSFFSVWSFGMVLVEMLTFKAPYHNVPILQIPDMVQKGIIPNVPENLPAEMAPIISIVKRCLQLEPSVRPTAAQLVLDFAQLL